MSASLASPAGRFVWYDLMTTDVPAAQAFYEEVVGWRGKDSGVPGHSYTIFSVGETVLAGLMPIPEDARRGGVPPAWMGYVGVDDVDAWALRLQAAGGRVHRPGTDIPGVGRFAVVGDPEGAGFMLFSPLPGQQAQAKDAPDTPGRVGWRELRAGEPEGEFAFYAKLFGWTLSRAVDMGEAGTYRVFGYAGEDAGGVMTRPPPCPMASWLYYFNVDAIDAAADRVRSAGGRITTPPVQVPTGQWVLNAHDPQGAEFALLAPRR
jgi:predicted enzyme related to lactoylglutathione lyase